MQNTTRPNTHTFTSSYKRFITWCNGVPGEQRELVIKYRSVNVTVFNTMAAVTLFLFLFGLNCHPRSARYGRPCITLPHSHWLCMTECFTFKNLVQRPLSLQHTRGWEREREQEQKLGVRRLIELECWMAIKSRTFWQSWSTLDYLVGKVNRLWWRLLVAVYGTLRFVCF